MRLLRLACLALVASLILPREVLAQRVDDPAAFIAASVEGLQMQTEANSAMWGLGEEENWSVDLDSSTIRFVFGNGTLVTAPVQVVGTYNPDNGTFLWGWDHPSVPEPLREHAHLVHAFGQENGMPELTERMVEISEERAWELTALAARLGQASGAYRANPEGGPFVFFTFGNVTISRQ